MDNNSRFIEMKPKYFEGKWYIEVETEELENVLLLQPGHLPTPIQFDTEEQALAHIESKK